MLKPLTDRDLDVLNELVACQDSAVARMERTYAMSIGFAPLEFGGSNRSHHSKTALKLVKHGFAEARKRGKDWGDTTTRDVRGSNVYRPTEAGREAIDAWRTLHKGKMLKPAGLTAKYGHVVPASSYQPLAEEDRKLLRRKCHLDMPDG